MDFKTVGRAIAMADMTLDVYQVLNITEAVMRLLPNEPFNLHTQDGRVAFARTLPDVMREVNAGRKIQAIKALRTALQDAHAPCGLKESKEAIDPLMPHRVDPWA